MRIFIFLVLAAAPAIASAEVSDKMLSIPMLWVQAITLGVFAFFICWFRWWMVAAGVAFGALLCSGTFDLWNDIYMREAVLKEQGMLYFGSLVAADLLVVAASVTGATLAWKRRNTAQRALATNASEMHR